MNQSNRQNRSEATRNSLMRAAEKLTADYGLENVTVRAIIELSGQKNESALQYHFTNRAGLLKAIHVQRNSQLEEKRRELLSALLGVTDSPSLRQICALMVKPAFVLAQSDSSFMQYVKGFGRELAFSEHPASQRIAHSDQRTSRETMKLLKDSLRPLDEKIIAHRFDSAARFASLSMSVRARQANAFKGPDGEFFVNMLIDSMAGLLAAEVSQETLKNSH